jgi:DNA adenine methylase
MHSDKQTLERDRVSILSPLRYPGSKRRLAGYIKETLRLNGCHPELFIEPFAGGASVALQLLNDKMVEQIGLIEIDPLVADFWKTAFFDADWLVNQVETIEVTLEQWDKFKNLKSSKRRDRALACLFLNRTSFSGILARSGPIGGREQKSAYSIDCRFPRKTLVKRIRQAESLKHKVKFVWNISWRRGISLIHEMQNRGALPTDIFFYFDPPFFEKANELYRYYFKDLGHRQLRDSILSLKTPWILSYDSIEQVKELYSEAKIDTVYLELLYSTSKSAGNRVAQEVLLTNLQCQPPETRLWRQKAEWKISKSSLTATQDFNTFPREKSSKELLILECSRAEMGMLNKEVIVAR